MWRHSCFATVHDCPYWQLPSGAWHLAQCRKNSSHLLQKSHEVSALGARLRMLELGSS